MKIIFSAAMRGRYNADGKTSQKLETRFDEIANAITTINTDSVVLIKYKQNTQCQRR